MRPGNVRIAMPPASLYLTASGWLAAVRTVVDPGALLLLVVANSTPVIIARVLGNRFDTPIDALFRRHGERPLFGAHKTWRGLVSGALACTCAGALLSCGPWVGLGFGLLALGGDLASSFVKRRMRLRSGYSAPLLDQIPESLLPLLTFNGVLGLTCASVFGTTAVFTLLDFATTRWRERVAQGQRQGKSPP
jgi:hypothetical protein